jgi:hypothetical protein
LLLPILIIIALGVILSVYAFRGRRAMFKVIEIFRQHNALGISDAKTLQELGIERPDFARRIVRGRDFKQYALQILIKRGIICVTEDGRLYMVEDKLDEDLRLSGFLRNSK